MNKTCKTLKTFLLKQIILSTFLKRIYLIHTNYFLI